MSDLYTSTVPLVSAVEVKRYGGDTAEAELQLGTWQAAALAHFHCMFVGQDGRISTSLPQIGWSVIGHTWAFHIAWKDGVRGPTTIRGPFLPGAGSTATYHGIFTLLSLLCNMFDWLLDTYWPEFARCVSASYVPTT
ncbi:hypothetical protein BDV97DRAFT_147398 [Delphinella strobiligena]|nr:hypothetical protein BDV97DRAFT_147398 [Delphinella strobiligena]